MRAIDKLNRFIGLYLATFSRVFRFGIWVPLAIYALLQVAIVILAANFTNPALYGILKPLVALLGDRNVEVMSHYPGIYLVMPSVVAWGKYILGVLFEGLVMGMAAVLFVRAYSDTPVGMNYATAFKKWLPLLIVWCFISALILAANQFIPGLFSSYLAGSPRRIMLFGVAMKLVTVFIYSPFIYAIPAVIVYGNGILRALRTSLSLFAEYPIFSFFLALIPYLLTVPFSYMYENAGTIVSKFTPELMLYLLIGGVIIDMVVNFILSGTVVKFLLDERR